MSEEINIRPCEFNDENRRSILECFTLGNVVWLQDMELIDYVYTSLQYCEQYSQYENRFQEDNENLTKELIEMGVTIEILEYFDSKGRQNGFNYFKPIEHWKTFEKNKNNVAVCKWIVSRCGVSEHFEKTLESSFKKCFSSIVDGGDVDVVEFILEDIAPTAISFDTYSCFLNLARVDNKDMLKYLLINPRIRNMFMTKISYLDYEGLLKSKKNMKDEFITYEDFIRFGGDDIIYSIITKTWKKTSKYVDILKPNSNCFPQPSAPTQPVTRKYADVLNELMIVYRQYMISLF